MKRWGLLIVLAACSSQNLKTSLRPVDLYGQWENPDKRLTAYPGYSDYGSYGNAWTIAVRDTMVHIVWEHRVTSGVNPGELYYRKSINSGSSFDPDTQLTTEDSHHPSVAIRDSIVHIIWHDVRDGNAEIYYKRSIDNGETWGIIDERLTDDLAASNYPSVAVRDSIVHVVWMDKRDGNEEIYYNRSVDNGATWGIIDERLSDVPAYSGYPSVAVHDSIVYVVWFDKWNGNCEIYYNRSVDNGETWGANERLTDDLANSYCPSVAVRDSIVHVVWYDWRDGNEEIYYKRSVDNGATWGIIDERLSDIPAASNYPSIAVCGSTVHVVWYDWRDGDEEIYYKRSDNNGETWKNDERLTDAVGMAKLVSVACWDCSYDYDVHVAWTDHRDGNEEIYYKRHKCEGASVEESEELKVKRLELEVFPNPCTKKTVIHYSLNGNRNDYTINDLRLTIYDLSGRLVKRLLDNEVISGNKIEVNLEELTNGIYFVKMETHTGLATSSFTATKKLTILK